MQFLLLWICFPQPPELQEESSRAAETAKYKIRKLQQRLLAFTLLLWVNVLLAASSPAADVLNWRTNNATVSADIKDGKLSWLLEEITAATGWQVFMEPDVSHVVSTKFDNLPQGEALRLLLGDLNFGLIPTANGHYKLFVFRTTIGSATQAVTIPTAKRGTTPGETPSGRPRRPDQPGSNRTQSKQ